MLGKPLKELEALFGKKSSDERIIKGFAVDSRNTMPGCVFFALKGAQVDGHDYLLDIAQKGALAAVVSSSFQGEIEGLVLLKADDVLDFLQKLARDDLAKQKKRIVAITGSMGKTTTKEFAATLLSASFKVFKTPGNANSQIGLPLSLLNKEETEEEIIVLEMGMMAHGEIAKLVQIAPPELAVVTKIAPAHLEFFPNGLEGIAQAKSEILTHPKTKHAIINSQASIYSAIDSNGSCKKTYFSLEKDRVCPHKDFWMESEGEKLFICSLKEKSPAFILPFDAPHLKENFFAAVMIARYFGISFEKLIQTAKHLELFQKRFEKIEKNGVTFINDSYNANPESMKAALSHLPLPKAGGRVIAALGHMVELGSFCRQMHAEIGGYASQYADKLICLGEKCLPMKEAYAKSGKPVEHYFDINEMQKALFAELKDGDVVLIKASNSVKLWRLFDEENTRK